jgi:hypothetical protein
VQWAQVAAATWYDPSFRAPRRRGPLREIGHPLGPRPIIASVVMVAPAAAWPPSASELSVPWGYRSPSFVSPDGRLVVFARPPMGAWGTTEPLNAASPTKASPRPGGGRR